MLNKNGFTLIELLATMVILGIVMAVTVPNIVGITTANRTQTYAEDAKKLVSTAEYKLRGDDTMVKPESAGHCVVMTLGYVGMTEFNTAPYGGEYMQDDSYVVMIVENRTYKYYVQLYEKLSDGSGYRGFRLNLVTNLDGDGYLDLLDEGSGVPSERAKNDGGLSDRNLVTLTAQASSESGQSIVNIAKNRVNADAASSICTTIDRVYVGD